jgi:glycosyltransferase involved in cell wall biosynthesis
MYFLPGIGYFENYLPKEEKRLGNEVFIITSNKIPSLLGDDDMRSIDMQSRMTSLKDSFYDKVLVRRLPHFFHLRSIKQVILKGLVHSLQEFDPDIIVLPFLDVNSMLVMLIKPLLKCKIVAACGMPVEHPSRATSKLIAYRIFKSYMVPIFSRFVDAFFETTPENLERDVNELHINPHRIHFVPLGADAKLFERDERIRKRTRKMLGIEEDDVLYVYSGKLKKDKGLEILVDAFAKLVRSCRKAKLLIIGNGASDFVNRIWRRVLSYGIGENFILHDFVLHSELPNFYSAADIAVWPGSPSISIQEAIASGLPVIVKKSGHTVHLLKYNNGFSFSSADELYVCMEKLYRNIGLRKRMSVMSRRLAQDELDWAVIAQKMNTLYRSLLSPKDQNLSGVRIERFNIVNARTASLSGQKM